MKRVFLFSLLIFEYPVFLASHINAQQNDFQCWPSVVVSAEVLKNLKLQFEEEARFHENITRIYKQINDIGLSYRINKYIKTAIVYRIEADWKNADTYAWRRGIYADLSLSHEAGRFSFGYRARIATAKVEINEKQPLFMGFRNRHKLSIEYNIKNSRFTPLVEGEIFLNLGDNDTNGVSAYRAWIGVNYDFNKLHEVGLKYGIDQELNIPDPLRAFIIAFHYSLNLKL